MDDASPFDDAAARVAAGEHHHAVAAELVAQMTLHERLGCLDGDTPFWPGVVDMSSGGYYRHPWPAAVVERLGIPGIQFADGPRGAVIADATAFPVSMARGAAFDPALEERVGDAIGLELRAAGATFTGAVCMNLLRHPAWGRAQETYGEDPHHVGVTAAAFTRGLQRHLMACMKHFALNSMENARFRVDVTADERALHEVYLPHFRRVAADGVASTMSAYNSVNGQWCGENRHLLTEVLRDEWGWDGFVVSDFVFGLRDPVASVRAGLDIEMPFAQQRATTLPAALEAGDLDAADVERAARRIVATLLRFARVFAHRPGAGVIGSAPHRQLARQAAASSMVLVRNEGRLLPVAPDSVGSIVVLGRLADRVNLGDGGSSDVRSSSVVTPLDGLRSTFGVDAVHHAPDLTAARDRAAAADADLVVVVVGYTKADEGEYLDQSGTAALATSLFPPTDHPAVGFGAAPASPPDASTAVGDADASGSIAPAGGPDTQDATGSMAPGGDRASLRLGDADEALIAAASTTSERVVVVVQCGSAVMMPWADDVPAVLYGWYAGVEGGAALADVLSGDREPGGRLPFAVPTDESHLPDFDRDADTITYDLFHGQWRLDRDGHEPLFPFGHGLGYTRWDVDTAEWVGRGGTTVRLRATNVGDRAGSTVLFAFAGMTASAVDRPKRRLVAYRKITADAGATVEHEVDLDWALLDVRRDGRWWTEPGDYVVEVGQWANDPGAIRLTTERGGPAGPR